MKSLWLSAIAAFGLSVAIDVVIAIGLARWLTPNDIGMSVALLIGAAWGVGLYYTIKGFVIEVAWPPAAAGKQLAAIYANEDFPQPERWESASQFFERVAGDQDVSISKRIRAAAIGGELAGSFHSAGAGKKILLTRVANVAVGLLAK